MTIELEIFKYTELIQAPTVRYNVQACALFGFAAEKLDHYRVWTDAILNGKQANSHFDYAAPLNETVMVGTIAQRLPGRMLKWSAPVLSFDDAEANTMVRRRYRKGWEIDALKG